MNQDDTMRMVYLMILLVAVGGWIMVEYRTRIGFALRTALAWGMIFLGVMAGYGLWMDIRDDVMPHQSVTEKGEIAVPRGKDGHYYLTIEIDGKPVRFMADTGASSVVLTRADAERLGFRPDDLNYLGTAQTANGMVRTARIGLKDMTLGPFTDTRVPAFVNEGDLDTSLLGMDYLGRFHISIGSGKMVLSR